MDWNIKLGLGVLALSATLFSGCGTNQGANAQATDNAQTGNPLNEFSNNHKLTAQQNSSTTSGNGTVVSDQEYNCPTMDNILYRGTDSYNGQHNFKVCVSRSNTKQFTILDSTPTPNTRSLCAYPLQKSSNSLQVLSNCKLFSLAPGGSAVLDFSTVNASANLNYMVIVAADQTNAMDQALGLTPRSGGSTSYPPYSEGFVQ